MLSPLREPTYAATARTVSGSLCELERVIGDSLFTGYVGYNGRAPGASTIKKEDLEANNDRNKSGGDARHTLVAYFEIVELSSILFVDRETVNLAIRIFRHTASNTSLRNRNVESLATAAFVAASQHRYWEYQQWLKSERQSASSSTSKNDDSSKPDPTPPAAWPVPPRLLSVEEVAIAANLEISEVQRNLKVVNTALRKQKQEGPSSIIAHMPKFCCELNLSQRTRKLAMDIVDRIVKYNICHRRNPVSVAAAAIYLACQLDSVRKTQTEICRVTSLTEVTLRKVHKELNVERKRLIPEWFKRPHTLHSVGCGTMQASSTSQGPGGAIDVYSGTLDNTHREDEETHTGDQMGELDTSPTLVPPPLPPGLNDDKDVKSSKPRSNEGPITSAANLVSKHSQLSQQHPDPQPATAQSGKNSVQNTDALLAMLNSPAVQAFTNVMSQMPQMMMPPPPPPPPLPPPLRPDTKKDTKESEKATTKGNQMSADKKMSPDTSLSAKEGESLNQPAPLTIPSPPQPPLLPMTRTNNTSVASSVVPVSTAPPVTGGDNTGAMAGLQSMMGMMQMMLQTAQQMGATGTQGPNAAANSFAMMAAAVMSQMQNGNSNSGAADVPTLPSGDESNSKSKTTDSSKPASQ